MSLLDRLKSKIFKRYQFSSIEYHTGGYFIRKKAEYIIFTSKNVAYFLEREEGLHPYDNRYDVLTENLGELKSMEFYERDTNTVVLKNLEEELRIYPSIFIENLTKNELTEILVDWGNGISKIYSCVYNFMNTKSS